VNELVITNALILPMTAEPRSFNGHVRVKDGIIADVVAGSPRAGAGAESRIDAGGMVLMPGLVNAHTHLYQVLLRAVWEDLPLIPWLERIYGVARVLRPEHSYAGSLLGCLEGIKSGATTVCEHNFLNPHPECAFEAARAIRESGLRAVFARTIMDTGEIVPDCVKEIPEKAFRHIENLIAGERQHFGRRGLSRLAFRTGPNTPPINTTPELLKEIRRFASEKKIGISAHVAESRSVVEYVRDKYGKGGVVEFLQDFSLPASDAIFAHCVHLSDAEIVALAATGTSVSHNPISNMMLGDGIAPVVEMLRAGVNVALGTDGAASNHSQDLFETMKAASLLQKVHHQDAGVISPYAVLRMATVGGARALGLEALCGTIEAGKRADLILVRVDTAHTQPINNLFSQLVHCAKASDVDTVMVDGEILLRKGVPTRLEEGRIIEAAQKANTDLLVRMDAMA
jgi:5-methylthioadenosine/S-adenosylhomocysteine deaminase